MQFTLNIQLFAHKKGQGSVKNGRDSNPKYLGVKKYDGEVSIEEEGRTVRIILGLKR